MIKVVEEDKVRIDNYLVEKLELSRSKIQKLIKDASDSKNQVFPTSLFYEMPKE